MTSLNSFRFNWYIIRLSTASLCFLLKHTNITHNIQAHRLAYYIRFKTKRYWTPWLEHVFLLFLYEKLKISSQVRPCKILRVLFHSFQAFLQCWVNLNKCLILTNVSICLTDRNVSQTHWSYTNPKAFVLMAKMILLRSTTLDEYRGIYSRDIQVLAVGRWSSSAGRIVMLGIGWNPSSLAGRAGLDVQK